MAAILNLELIKVESWEIAKYNSQYWKTRMSFPGKLAPQPPMKSLISFVPIASLLLQLIPIIGFQVLAFEYVQGEVTQVP